MFGSSRSVFGAEPLRRGPDLSPCLCIVCWHVAGRLVARGLLMQSEPRPIYTDMVVAKLAAHNITSRLGIRAIQGRILKMWTVFTPRLRALTKVRHVRTIIGRKTRTDRNQSRIVLFVKDFICEYIWVLLFVSGKQATVFCWKEGCAFSVSVWTCLLYLWQSAE